ncbi:glycosyl transferase [Microbacterium sp. ZW T5_45]|uniref:glycosyl transferase n=1 Tax=Microbacterium sp. ZW T5_45 TaxID=3378080 RepID=UPI003853808E
MRFVWAVVAFVVAMGLIGAGIAQRTIFQGPDHQTAAVEIDQPAPFIVIDSDVLRAHPGARLLFAGEGDIFAANGRTADMEAWLSDSTYNHLSVGDDGGFDVEFVEPRVDDADSATDGDDTSATPEPTETPAEGQGTDETDGADSADATETANTDGRSPVGSDLWLETFTGTDSLETKSALPDGVSMLVAYDGTTDAPTDITVTWPLDTSTPAAGPLVASGVLVLIVGLVLYVLAIRHQRRGRGPRRKGPGPLPVTEPIDVAALPPAEREALDAPADADASEEPKTPRETGRAEGTSERRAVRTPRRRWIAVPALALTAVLAAGCSADSWPQLDAASPTPSPTPTVIAPENQKPPAVTEGQAKLILEKISSTLADADASMDIELAKTRLEGAALAARSTEYALRTAIPETAVPAAIPTDDVEVVLPEATDRWPRTVLMLSQSSGDDTVPPVILTMTQQDPWSDYKISNIAEMSADVVLPEVVAPWLGTSLVPDDSAFLTIAPGELADAFADVVDSGEQSTSYSAFDELSQSFATSIRDSRQSLVQNLIDKGAQETAKTAFDMTASDEAPVSLATLDSGAIVAVSLIESQTITPASEDVSIRFGDDPKVKALTGVTESSKGIIERYGFQLFFAVPAQGDTEPIRLLAFRQDLLSAEVIQ